MTEKTAFKPFKFASFSSVADHNIKKFGKGLPSWCTITPGLSICGICKTPKCDAQNQYVWVTLGHGCFNMAQWIKKSPCPKCEQPLKKVHSASIYNCYLFGKGQKCKEGNQTEGSDFQQEGEEVSFQYSIHQEDSYLHFGNIQKEIIEWNYLVLKTTTTYKKCPKKHSLSQFKQIGRSWNCNQCNKKILRAQKGRRCQECNYNLCFDCS